MRARPKSASATCRSIAPFDPNDETATLTVRDTVWDRPTALPRRSWQFVAPDPNADRPMRADASARASRWPSGFEPGRIYEVKYRASNPPVSGVGLAAIRDVASAMKYGDGAIVPVRGRYLHVYGSSQSGRFLRAFLLRRLQCRRKRPQGLRRRDAAHRRRRPRRLQHAILAGGRARSVRAR